MGENEKTFYQWLIVTLALSCTVSEIRQLISSKSLIVCTPFCALNWGQEDPFRISGQTLRIFKTSLCGNLLWRFRDPSLHRFYRAGRCIRRTNGRMPLRQLRRAVARKNGTSSSWAVREWPELVSRSWVPTR